MSDLTNSYCPNTKVSMGIHYPDPLACHQACGLVPTTDTREIDADEIERIIRSRKDPANFLLWLFSILTVYRTECHANATVVDVETPQQAAVCLAADRKLVKKFTRIFLGVDISKNIHTECCQLEMTPNIRGPFWDIVSLVLNFNEEGKFAELNLHKLHELLRIVCAIDFSSDIPATTQIDNQQNASYFSWLSKKVLSYFTSDVVPSEELSDDDIGKMANNFVMCTLYCFNKSTPITFTSEAQNIRYAAQIFYERTGELTNPAIRHVFGQFFSEAGNAMNGVQSAFWTYVAHLIFTNCDEFEQTPCALSVRSQKDIL